MAAANSSALPGASCTYRRTPPPAASLSAAFVSPSSSTSFLSLVSGSSCVARPGIIYETKHIYTPLTKYIQSCAARSPDASRTSPVLPPTPPHEQRRQHEGRSAEG